MLVHFSYSPVSQGVVDNLHEESVCVFLFPLAEKVEVELGVSGAHELDQCAECLCGHLGLPDVSDVCKCAVREGFGLLHNG